MADAQRPIFYLYQMRSSGVVLRLTVEVIKNCRHGRRSKAKFYLYQMRSSGACFASNCTSNKELPTWPTLKGQFFICIK